MRATAQISCSILRYSPVQHQASLVYVSSCSPNAGLPPGGHGENRCVHHASAGHEQESEHFVLFLGGYNWELGFGMDQELP